MAIIDEEKNRVTFQSKTLLTELIQKGQLRKLISVKTDKYPEYCFKATDTVLNIIDEFMQGHNSSCDRDVEDWSEYDYLIRDAEIKPETVITRQFEVVKRVIAEGYAYMLKHTGIDKYHKKYFVFYSNNRIIEIKNEEAIKSKARYEKRKATSRKETSNEKMSRLLKKTMEDRK